MDTSTVHESIRRAMVSGELAVGQIVSERELSERLGLSKTPVAEAMSELAWRGWVSVLPRQGYRVADVPLSHVWESLALWEQLLARRHGTRQARTPELGTTVADFWAAFRAANTGDLPWQAAALGEVNDQLERVVVLLAGADGEVPEHVAAAAREFFARPADATSSIPVLCRSLRRWIQDLLMQSQTPLSGER